MTIDDILVEPPTDETEVVDPMGWFESPGDFEIEIGCGKGGFLLNRTRSSPDLRLLGIEWANKYTLHCADRMARWNLENVRVMRTDGGYFIKHHLPPACLSALHLYHPDPWPKKRHHKRRIVQPDFITAVIRALKPGGHWLFQSDHQEYYALSCEMLDVREELAKIAWEDTGVDPGEDWVGTNFEVKYAREGRTIYQVAYVKR